MMREQDSRRPEVTTLITEGVMRHLVDAGFSVLPELPLVNGRRVDVMGLNDKGDITIVEVKSSREDFQADEKWAEYLPSCDRFYFAVSPDFPREILPEDSGLIVADGFGAAIIRDAPVQKMHATARKAIMLRFARTAAKRLWQAANSLPEPAETVSGRVF